MRRAPFALLLVASCATTLYKEDVKRQSDGWTLVFHELAAGPDGFTTRGGTGYVPPSGERYLWVVLSIRNDAARARKFIFASCSLELGDQESLPLYVGLNFGTTAQTDDTPELASGEVITRKLAFSYPEGRLPSRLTCFGNVVELK
jgi:hypothetical protein